MIVERRFGETPGRDPTGGWGPDRWREAELAAAALGLTIMSVQMAVQEDFESVGQKLSQEHLDAIVIWDAPLFWRNSGLILGFARASRLPVMASGKEDVELGALISYGADARATFRRAATYVSRILHGANPAPYPWSGRRPSNWPSTSAPRRSSILRFRRIGLAVALALKLYAVVKANKSLDMSRENGGSGSTTS